MDIFGVGGPELFVLLLLGGLVLGPRRIAELGREFGKIARQIQNLARDVSEELKREIDLVDQKDRQPASPESDPTPKENPALPEESVSSPNLPGAYLRIERNQPPKRDSTENLNDGLEASQGNGSRSKGSTPQEL